MSAFYTNLTKVAKSLLTQYGHEVTLSRISGETFDGPTGEYSGGTPISWTGYGARFMYSKYELSGDVLATDMKLVLESVTVVPKVGDTVTYDSIEYSIVNVKAIAPSTSTVYYELQLRL